ncbi:MAG: hypothetical protein KTR32_39255 [Granulosicoccus sp.]|nr:hypothetical protein [Granulosicoccus sp.]
MRTFNIGISARLYRSDGSTVIPEFDVSPLADNAAVKLEVLPDVDAGDLLHEKVKHLDAAILFLERISPITFGPDSRLTVLARYGVGYDTVDIEACNAANVAVAIAPSGVRRPVATTVIALLLALTLNLPAKDRITREGAEGWQRKTNYNGLGLVGRTLGGVGIGNIGAEVFRLIQPFDMKLIAHDPWCDPATARTLGVELVALDDVFTRSDIVTVNCPLNEQTHHLVNAERLALMKPEAYLINTARGPIVDEEALIDALQNNRIRGAGLDVFEEEPPAADNPLLTMDNVILAPHALCFTDQCLAGLGKADTDACLAVMQGELPETLVNAQIAESPEFKAKLDTYRATFSS